MTANENTSGIYQLIKARAESNPGAIAIEAPGRYPLTYAGLHRYVQTIMMAIHSTGIKSGERVAVVLPDGPEMAITLLGVASAAVCVPLNPAYKQAEFETCYEDLRIRLVVAESGVKTAARQAVLRRKVPVLELPINRDAESDLISARRSPMFGPARHYKFYKPPEEDDFNDAAFQAAFRKLPAADDLAVVMQTTGTTAKSKVVPLTHRNICVSAANIRDSLELTEIDRCLGMLPQFHIGGFVDMLLAPIISGGTTICTAGFETSRFFSYVRQFQPTWFQGVPTMLNELLNHATKNSLPGLNPPLRFIRSVSSPLPPSLMKELESCLKVPVIEIYGMTEAGPLIASNPVPPAIRKPGSVGIASGPDVAIMNNAGEFVSPMETGEVVIRGSNVFSGYENSDESNQMAFHDNWFRSGDLGAFDSDGYLFLKGRIKDMINRGGEKISPHEIDSTLLDHPAVAEAVSFPIPHSALGENVAAVVVCRDEMSVSEGELKQWLSERLTDFKVPQRILFRDRLPRGATGKIRRLGLAEELGLDFSVPFVAPRNEVEIAIASIWSALLNVEQVGIRDDFFELGGHSLLGVEMIDQVERLIGRPLPEFQERLSTIEDTMEIIFGDVSEVFVVPEKDGNNSIDNAAREVRSAIARTVSVSRVPRIGSGSLLMELNRDATDMPLYWCFNKLDMEMERLALAIGTDKRLIGMYSGGGLFDYTRTLVKATAELHVNQIIETTDAECILLAGHCRGAAVAHDMAIELMRQGRTVRLLLMEYFDTILFEYPSDFTLFYGKDSLLGGYKAFNYGNIGWRERFANAPEVVLIEGNHGRFWSDPYLYGFGQAVREFMQKNSHGFEVC